MPRLALSVYHDVRTSLPGKKRKYRGIRELWEGALPFRSFRCGLCQVRSSRDLSSLWYGMQSIKKVYLSLVHLRHQAVDPPPPPASGVVQLRVSKIQLIDPPGKSKQNYHYKSIYLELKLFLPYKSDTYILSVPLRFIGLSPPAGQHPRSVRTNQELCGSGGKTGPSRV